MNNLFAGIDFPDAFSKDNFDSRRTTGNNLYDPESLITGAELEEGLTYTNSRRRFAARLHYIAAVNGLYTVVGIAVFSPRVRVNFTKSTVRQVMDASENEV